MAKDDYNVIVFKILLYYYAVLKRKIPFEEITFSKTTNKEEVHEEYFTEILSRIQEDGLIKNAIFKKVWGGEIILISDLDEIKITSRGIEFLKENSYMKKIKETLSTIVNLTSKLIQITQL